VRPDRVSKQRSEKKMKVQITRGTKGGKNFQTIEIDGKYNSGYIQSRTVTGTTDETGDGIFTTSDKSEFTYGDQRKGFAFNPININTPKKEYMAEIKERIKAVREWVTSCDYEEKFSFEV
jgi:hypothetical protein